MSTRAERIWFLIMASDMEWILTLARTASKNLEKAPAKDRGYLHAALALMCEDPFSGNSVHLRNMTPAFRRRVGSYRILFDVYTTERLIQVHDIRRRNEKTYRKKKR